MATDSNVRSVTNTLTTTVADTVTLLQPWPYVAVTNHHATELLSFRQDGTTAVGSADGCTVVPGARTMVRRASLTSAGTTVISVVGSGNIYTIEGVNSPNSA